MTRHIFRKEDYEKCEVLLTASDVEDIAHGQGVHIPEDAIVKLHPHRLYVVSATWYIEKESEE